jgi:DNA-binding transcriptional LysR family regulator
MRREYPGILLSVLIPGGAAQVLNEVRQGRAELGLTELPDRADALHACPLETQEITLVLPPGIAADLPDPVPLAALAGVPLVTTDAGTTTMPETNAQIGVECAHRPAVWELVRQGAGATFLSRRLAERHLRDVVVRSLSPRLERSIGLVFRPGPVSPAARAFLSIAGVSIAGVAKLPGRAD